MSNTFHILCPKRAKLGKYCTIILKFLHQYCTNIMQSLCKYCMDTVRVYCKYLAKIVQKGHCKVLFASAWRVLRGQFKIKNTIICGKVHNFLDPPSPRIIWTFLNLGKNWFLMTPPSTEIGKNLKCRLFWYRCIPSKPC